ncbi:capsular polysaccharide biosynthesis protein [Pontibaca salina]|uniref:capsular polysaccharide biosynthesis protein n=1 Tax=Pontibaca salina TaxID=2795731 RepID=UPI001E448D28|nr:capsular polysaccharide biosynthesis protein [Pontibaca salina]
MFAFNGGLFTQRVRRILTLSGYHVQIGLPRAGDMVGIWGNSPTAWRGRAVAARRALPLLRIEDAFLRSLHPGRAGEAPISLVIDRRGVHFDASAPSDLEHLLATAPLTDTKLLDRARDAIKRMREAHLSKYSGYDVASTLPAPGYVLIVDQTRGDASVRASGGDIALFQEMLRRALEEHPEARFVIKTHPETSAGYRPGHYSAADANERITIVDWPISPWALLKGAQAVYTLSSQLGFEAILAGHRPRVFGTPFYAGWGLTHDETPLPRRQRRLTSAQLFAASMILYPHWYDPFRDRLCEIETVLDNLEAQVSAWRQDHAGWVASGMRLWKRAPLQAMFGQQKRMIFDNGPARAARARRSRMVWAGHASCKNDDRVRVEDGFLRSFGLGAALVPPLSLVLDDLGIYYDPSRPSRLEQLIETRAILTPRQQRRAEALIDVLISAGLSKYNLPGATPELPEGYRILVPGQVADDASIRTGTDRISTNIDMLRAARAANPQAVIIYKPHPDVEAGLRDGAIAATELADVVVTNTDPAKLLSQVDAVWTMTSLLGFEALLRGLPVTTLGAPFYAGWGLTTDLGKVPERRRARPSLAGLAHAALIDYPRYLDPVTNRICPVEVIAERLADGTVLRRSPGNRALSKLQGLFASCAPLWR